MAGYLRTTLVSGCGAALVGGLLGMATVQGVRTRTTPVAPIYPRAAAAVDTAPASPDCPGCSTYDAGYRWASARHTSRTDDCFGADWARQRGCLAFVGGDRTD